MTISAATGLEVRSLSLAHGRRRVVHDLNLSLPQGRVTAILGPNGCGKSTLLHALARLHPAQSGQILLQGQDIHQLPPRAMAQRLSILPQAPLAPPGIRVSDLVRRGRAPWRGLLQPWSDRDAAACDWAIQTTGLADLAQEPVDCLSGGQRQRAWIALVLAQTTPWLLLDEPTTWLDLPHQIEVLGLLQKLNRDKGTTVISVLHDLNLAARFSDHLVLLGPQGLVADGPPDQVLTETHLARAFGLAARILPDPVTGAPMVCPL
jgi:iron complex transport system ATP-binding protein